MSSYLQRIIWKEQLRRKLSHICLTQATELFKTPGMIICTQQHKHPSQTTNWLTHYVVHWEEVEDLHLYSKPWHHWWSQQNLTSANPLIMWFHPLWHSYCLFFISDSVNHLHPRTSSLQLDTQCSKREAHASPQPGEPTVSIDWNNRSSGPGSGSGLQIWQWWPVPVGLSPGLCLNFRPIKISNTHSLLMIELCKLLRSAFVF